MNEPAHETVRSVGEKRLVAEIRELVPPPPPGVLGIGDDAAVLPCAPGEDVVLSTDRIPSDLLAVRAGLMDMATLGRYLAEVNVSDLAAMGASPQALLLNITLTDDFLHADFRDFLRGFGARGQELGAPLVGGDTCGGRETFFSATAFGTVPHGRALKRSTARPGDLLFVSGEIGGFSAALSYFFRGDVSRKLAAQHEEALLEKLVRPVARIALGAQLMASGSCTSCVDVTDGFAESVRELERAGTCEFEISAESLPLYPSCRAVADLLELDPLELALSIGLDLELLGTLNRDVALPELTHIGVATPRTGQGSLLRKADTRRVPLPPKGWQHFAGDAAEFIVKRQ